MNSASIIYNFIHDGVPLNIQLKSYLQYISAVVFIGFYTNFYSISWCNLILPGLIIAAQFLKDDY